MNKKIVLYLFIGLSIFVMACGDDNVGTTTTIEDFESSSLALYKYSHGGNQFRYQDQRGARRRQWSYRFQRWRKR